jgi:hypothetical protein
VNGSVGQAGIGTKLLPSVKPEGGICWELKLLGLLIVTLLANEWTMTSRDTNRTLSLQDVNKQGISLSLKVSPSLKTDGNALSQTVHL